MNSFFTKIKKFAPLALVVCVLFFGIAHFAHAGFGEDIKASIIAAISEGLKDLSVRIANIMLSISSWFLWLSGVLLNGVVYYTVTNFKTTIGNAGAIRVAWGVIRDIANMAFIFVLLLAGIKTVLQIGPDIQKLIRNIIIAALFINFSFFIVQVVIDASNIVSLAFVRSVTSSCVTTATKGAPNAANFADGGLSNCFMNAVRLTTIFDAGGKTNGTNVGTQNLVDAQGSLMVGIMGSIFILIAAFVFFAASIMLLHRFVEFIILLILSPLAFLGLVLPKAPSGDFWTKLINQAMSAPAFFLMTFITLKIALDPSFKIVTGADGAGLLATINGSANNSIQIVLNFSIVIGLLMFAIVFSKKFGATTSSGASKFIGGAILGGTGYGLRKTLGRGATYLNDTDFAKRLRSGGVASRLLGRSIQGAAQGSYDVRGTKSFGRLAGATGVDLGKSTGEGGFKKTFEVDVKNKQEQIKNAGGASRETASNLKVKTNELVLQQQELERVSIEQNKIINNPSSTPTEITTAKGHIDTARAAVGNISLEIRKLEKRKKNEIKAAQASLAARIANKRSLLAGRWYISAASKTAGKGFLRTVPEAKDDQLSAFIAQKESVLKAIVAGTGPVTATLASELGSMTSKQIKELDGDVLALPGIAQELSVSNLEAIKSANELTNTQTRSIANVIRNRMATEPALATYLAGPAGSYWA